LSRTKQGSDGVNLKDSGDSVNSVWTGNHGFIISLNIGTSSPDFQGKIHGYLLFLFAQILPNFPQLSTIIVSIFAFYLGLVIYYADYSCQTRNIKR
jgi:hypothetical protein